MGSGAKIRRMIEYELINCRKNIAFYKDQMRKNQKNRQFYAQEIAYMEDKIKELRTNVLEFEKNFGILSDKVKSLQ